MSILSGDVSSSGFRLVLMVAANCLEVNHAGLTASCGELDGVWNTLADLAEMAGKVEVSIRAESEKGFGKSKLLERSS